MRNFLTVSSLLLLSACASIVPASNFYQGNSTTYGNDNILRNDVVNQIKKIEMLGHSCRNVDSVSPKIVDLKEVNGLNHVQEIWTVQACGKTHRYPVSLRESASGGVDFTVTFNGKEQ